MQAASRALQQLGSRLVFLGIVQKKISAAGCVPESVAQSKKPRCFRNEAFYSSVFVVTNTRNSGG
jgi:hypothetical protein